MKLSKHAKFWALGALGGVWLFALGVFAQQNGALDIDSTNQDLFSDLKAVFFLERKDNNEIDSIVRLNVSNGTVVSAPTSDLAGGEAKNTLQNNASIIGSTNSVNTSSGAFLIATNSGHVQGESMQSFIWGASNTTLNGYNAIAVATKNTNLKADNTLALAAKDSTVSARDSVVLGGENITINPAGQASLAVWSKINVLGASGALVFNGKTIPLQVDTASAHTMVVNADNGLIINTNNSNNQKIQLTVSGAIKLWEVNNAPAQASPYISVKTKGSVTCVCGKVNNQNSALSKYTRGNKQIADLCQKVCDDQNTTLTAQCGAAATNYPLTQTQWSTDDFCQWGLGHAGAKPTFPALGGQVSWTCESFPSGGPTCTATRKGCWDGIRAAGEQCDLGTNNGKPDSNCSTSCENVKAPKCWANAKTYLGSDVAWAQPNGFCADDSVLGEATPAFWNGYTSWQKTWTCKNKNNKTLTCSANRLPPAVAGACGTTLNTCSAGTLSGQTSIAHGKRWSCDGLYGGSNKTCSTCDSGYKYNTTTNICEVDCPNPIYRHTNGVTIKAAACAESGKEYMFEGQKYYVARNKGDIKAKITANTYPANRIVTTRVTEMERLFSSNNTFNQDIWNWDTSNVTNMRGMFDWAKAFNQPLDYWDTHNVTDMRDMFHYAITFNQSLNNWNTSNVTFMSSMFHHATAFNQPLNNWDTRNVIDMAEMFRLATSFNQPLNNWNTSNVTDMRKMFYWAQVFNQPLNNRRINQLSDENLRDMFGDATSFKDNQPYCNWANWSAKKWNFVSMGLNNCVVTPSCSAWFTAHNGKCVRWKCTENDGDWICIEKDPTAPTNCSIYSKKNQCLNDWECIWKKVPRSIVPPPRPARCEGTYVENWKTKSCSKLGTNTKCEAQSWCRRKEATKRQSPKLATTENSKCEVQWVWLTWDNDCLGSTAPRPVCGEWDCGTGIKSKNKCVGISSESKCKEITTESICENSYEVEEICSIIGIWCRGFGKAFITKERASNIPDWTPTGLDASNWIISQIHYADWLAQFVWSPKSPGYARKIGPCQWGEKEQIVVCKDVYGNILSESNCASIPKPGKSQVCLPQIKSGCYEADYSSVPSAFNFNVDYTIDWAFILPSHTAGTLEYELKTHRRAVIDARRGLSEVYLYIPLSESTTRMSQWIKDIKWIITLKGTLTNWAGGFYPINKVYELDTEVGIFWSNKYIKVPLQESTSNKYLFPCNWVDDNRCVIKFTSVALSNLEKIKIPCPTPTPSPTPLPTPPSEDISWLYRATSYSRRPECIGSHGNPNPNGLCDNDDGYFHAGSTNPSDWISTSVWSFWDPFVVFNPSSTKKIWIKDGYAYWDKEKTQPVEVWVFKLTKYWASGDEIPYKWFVIASQGYWPGYQLWRGRVSHTLN